jgi:mannose-1-phosphate guanylyltransferase/mannose-6-phosphate isomerase
MKEVKRPWGNFKRFVLNKKCTVKILTLKPHQELSLQKHKKRRETWYFLTPGYVQLKNKKFPIKRGEFITIPKNTLHRLISKGKQIQILEISFGKFLESDEIRLEDKYKRK